MFIFGGAVVSDGIDDHLYGDGLGVGGFRDHRGLDEPLHDDRRRPHTEPLGFAGQIFDMEIREDKAASIPLKPFTNRLGRAI